MHEPIAQNNAAPPLKFTPESHPVNYTTIVTFNFPSWASIAAFTLYLTVPSHSLPSFECDVLPFIRNDPKHSQHDTVAVSNK